jgi:hypothetical protein
MFKTFSTVSGYPAAKEIPLGVRDVLKAIRNI